MNKTSSIKLKIAMSTGLVLTLALGILMVFSVSFMRKQAVELAESRATGMLEREVSNVKEKMETALVEARSLADALAAIPASGNKMSLSRDDVSEMLVTILKKNPDFLGIYTTWEPNAFDGDDSRYANQDGHDETGRFIPYFNRNAQGNIAREICVDYEPTAKNELGIASSAWYQIPKTTMKEAVIDPQSYEIQGVNTLLSSMVAPIKVDDKFYGITGIDYSVNFLQSMADAVDLYDKTANMILISHLGIIAGATGQPDTVGKHIGTIIKDPAQVEAILQAIHAGKSTKSVTRGSMNFMKTVRFGVSDSYWGVLLSIPEAKIKESANAVMYRQLGIGVVLILGGIIILWLISRTIASPLKETSMTLSRIANEGDFSVRVQVDQQDEIGQMADSINGLMTALQNAITDLNSVLGAVASGDLTLRVTSDLKGDLAKLKESSNQSIERLGDVLEQVRATSKEVNNGADELAGSAQALASGNSEQAASLEEVSSSMSEIGAQAKTNSENATQAQQLSNETMAVVEKGNAQMSEMLNSMDRINGTSTDISKIIKAIDEIAFQTNLLALNAAVEAARAGKYGKGFAVVADEVRNLAARSAEAAKTTTDLIENSLKEVERGVENAQKTDEVLKEISSSVTKINDMVGEISSGSNEQQSGIEEINKGLSQVNNVVQQNSSISEETASASEELSGQSTHLQQLITQFKIGHSTIEPEVQRPLLPEARRETPKQREIPQPRKTIMLDDDNFGKY